jgi:hypothetical protein
MTAERNQFETASRIMRADLFQFGLSVREMTVASEIISLTLDRGRSSIWIPRHEDLAELTGLWRQHITRSLRSLAQHRIVIVELLERGVKLHPLPDSRYWFAFEPHERVKRQASRQASGRSRENILAANDQAQLRFGFADLELTGAIGKVSIHASTDSVPWNQNSSEEPKQFLGTDSVHTKEKPMFTGVSTANAKSALSPPGPPSEGSEFRVKSFEKTLNSEPLSSYGYCTPRLEDELMARYMELCGPASSKKYGGGWRARVRKQPALVERILAEVNLMSKEGLIRHDAGATAFDLWKRWGGANQRSQTKNTCE